MMERPFDEVRELLKQSRVLSEKLHQEQGMDL